MVFLQSSFAKTISQESGTPEIARRLSIDLGDLGLDWKTVGVSRAKCHNRLDMSRVVLDENLSTPLEAIRLTARSPTLPTLVKEELTDLLVILFCRGVLIATNVNQALRDRLFCANPGAPLSTSQEMLKRVCVGLQKRNRLRH